MAGYQLDLLTSSEMSLQQTATYGPQVDQPNFSVADQPEDHGENGAQGPRGPWKRGLS
jgi:hypothetical protein